MTNSKQTKVGSILDEVTEGIIIQQVNAQGVMGSGFAKAIRDKWPKVWEEYSKEVLPNQPDKGLDYLGCVIYVQVDEKLWVANLVGQQFYGRDKGQVYTLYPAVARGLHSISNFAQNKDLDVHYPPIGCGLASGDWTIVSWLLDVHLVKINHSLWLQEQGS